jgi:hypothetical protein
MPPSPREKQGMSFDAEVWRAQDSDALEQENPRGAMVGTLTRDHLEPGTERKEILGLLGPPELQEGAIDYYELGRTPWGVSYERLAIEYADDELVRAFVTRT